MSSMLTRSQYKNLKKRYQEDEAKLDVLLDQLTKLVDKHKIYEKKEVYLWYKNQINKLHPQSLKYKMFIRRIQKLSIVLFKLEYRLNKNRHDYFTLVQKMGNYMMEAFMFDLDEQNKTRLLETGCKEYDRHLKSKRNWTAT